MTFLLYLLFFLSGVAALVYQVVWVRAFSLVFGGSHLAVTTVLSVFMGGLALGGWLFGRGIDEQRRPLRVYGWLELGIAASALAFAGLMAVYPSLYVPLARVAGEKPLALTVIRVLFAATAIIVPTTLMGGTLPVLVRFVTRKAGRIARHLSPLYAVNTLGAVAGTLAGAFLLLRHLGMNGSLATAIAINTAVGLIALAMPKSWLPDDEEQAAGEAGIPAAPASEDPRAPLAAQMVLWGIAISGFCALGYEVLWTRIVSVVIGTSVYGFAIMLVAFLAGIAAGSQVYGLADRRGRVARSVPAALLSFGAVQIVIGATALGVTTAIRLLPAHATYLQSLLTGGADGEFQVRQQANFLVAFAYMFVPAFFMGVAFPLAGTIQAGFRRTIGDAVGRVVSYNTVGAILGAATSGFVLIYVFGIERSLQLLSVINIGLGVCIASLAARARALRWVAVAAACGALIVLAVFPERGRVWDRELFAIFRNNQRDAFDTPEKIRDAVENTDVLYYHEGINQTISVIRPKGASQALLVNGKVVASTTPRDVQCQYTLGHLPMLLHPNPRQAFVLGLGTGMTLGAVSVHPGIEQVVLAELDRHVAPGARTFAEYNHDVLDNPKLRIVYEDGRNYLLTTRERFDVITADPIHPWTRGSAYLYTEEYYLLTASRLKPGGVMCQWLPIYELTPRDVATVVRTFQRAFAHSMLWLTQYDAELVGSNTPLLIDPEDLARRMAVPPIGDDLAQVDMGTPDDFVAYFVAGTTGLSKFAELGVINTDDNLYLEFSAPHSVGVEGVMGDNVLALTRHRESPTDYMAPPADPEERLERKARWDRWLEAAGVYDGAHARFLVGEHSSDAFRSAVTLLADSYADYAPARFLEMSYGIVRDREPRLLRDETFVFLDADGGRETVVISAVVMRIGDTRGVVMFVDNAAREVYGQRYIDRGDEELDAQLAEFGEGLLDDLRDAYEQEAASAATRGHELPRLQPTLSRLRELVAEGVTAGD